MVVRHVVRLLLVALMSLLTLLGCGTSMPSNIVPGIAVIAAPTKDAYIRQLCIALDQQEKRHRAWHVAHSTLQHHWDPSFVPTVLDPVLPVFANPPTSDRAQIAAMGAAFERASAKFTETWQHWHAGDRPAAEAAEQEATKLLFVDFNNLTEAYIVNEQACSSATR